MSCRTEGSFNLDVAVEVMTASLEGLGGELPPTICGVGTYDAIYTMYEARSLPPLLNELII